ncbi:MAG: hypothetical protein AAGA56_14830 [Myxococcota bacterium]
MNDVRRFGLKLHFSDPARAELELESIKLRMQHWIRDRRLGDAVIIDVADYRHVRLGTRLILVGHEEQYLIEDDDGTLALRYVDLVRGQPLDGERLRRGARRLLAAASALETDLGLSFEARRLTLGVDDRLVASRAELALSRVIEDAIASVFQAFAPHLVRSSAGATDGGMFRTTYELATVSVSELSSALDESPTSAPARRRLPLQVRSASH